MFSFRKNIDHNSSDEVLMSLLLKGSKPAFELLYERYFSKLSWYVQGFVKDLSLAEDIVQDVFIKLIDAPGKFDKERTFSTWIYTLCANKAKNHLRDEKLLMTRQKEHADLRVNQSISQQHHIDFNILNHRIHDILNGMSDKEKKIYTCRFEKQMSIRDIATTLNIPEGSVKSGIYYLLKKFSTQLNYQHHEN